jgi:ferredoxin
MALIHIEQWPAPIEARRLRVLEAALDAGVPYPYGCGTGECGSCKTQLLSGDITLDRYSPEALSDEERAQGIILACRARVVSDVRLRWLSKVAAPLPLVKVAAKVSYVGRVAHDVMATKVSRSILASLPNCVLPSCLCAAIPWQASPTIPIWNFISVSCPVAW